MKKLIEQLEIRHNKDYPRYEVWRLAKLRLSSQWLIAIFTPMNASLQKYLHASARIKRGGEYRVLVLPHVR